MRVCLVSHEYPPETAHGGIGTQTWNKAHALTQLGHEVEVLSCAGHSSKSNVRTSEESGVVVHRMQPLGEGPTDHVPLYDQSVYNIGYSWKVLVALQGIASQRAFDLVNFPEYGAEGFAFQLNRVQNNWMPIVVQLHGPLAMFSERIDWPEKDSPFARTAEFMEGESIRMADWLMASSANIADFTAKHYGVPRQTIDVVHCGIDCETFCPRERGASAEERPTVLFVGNVTASKGVVTVFEAVMRLRSRYPGILLRVLGKADDTWAKIESSAQDAGASRHVERVPFVKDRGQIAEIYRKAHVFASPADHEVGVANVYVEAMACGCPVIASVTGGAPEAVQDGETGLLVPPRNVDAVTAAIDQILGNADLRSRMGAAGRAHAKGYFAREKYIERVLAAYAKALISAQEKRRRLESTNQ